MANLLQSSQNTSTQAPAYYNNYLSNIAQQGAYAAGVQCGAAPLANAQFVGASCLQNQAFKNVGCAANAGNANLGAAVGTLGQAAGAQSPLSAAQPNLQGATTCVAQRAQTYMNPYVTCVVNAIGDLGQQNIRQNLAPMATAAAVGSGQFGSQRGAQVLGQTLANANQQILACQAKALQCGYKTALCTGLRQNTLCAQIGQTAGQLASAGQQNLTQAGTAQANLACQSQSMGLKGINALATLGCQQRTLLQNAQCYPLQKLTNLSNLLKGYTVPTTTTQKLCMSPLSAAASLAATATGIAKCNTLSGLISCGVKKIFCNNPITTSSLSPQIVAANQNVALQNATNSQGTITPSEIAGLGGCANGGPVRAARGGSIGCMSTRHMGGLPSYRR